ncbi:MAG: sensor histidine kinase, partial [Microcystaceae cyanobacterium]
VREGAQDYLIKRNANLDSLVRSICYGIERKQTEEKIRQENQFLEKNIQEQMEALNKAQQLNQLKSEFVSMISHDFRNPLNTILLSADLLEESRDKLTAEQQLKFFQMIRSAIKDMDHLLTEVLLLGRADSGKLSCHFMPLDLREFCEELVASLTMGRKTQEVKQQGDRPIELIFEGAIETEMWDKGLLRHILANLLTNAIKYSPSSKKIKFRCQIEEGWVTFRIEDQGIGIPAQALQHLFEPFYRANNIDGINGTGLGLTIVQCCVEVYGGQLQVQSELNQGSIFTVILPRQQPEEKNNVSLDQGTPSLGYPIAVQN